MRRGLLWLAALWALYALILTFIAPPFGTVLQAREAARRGAVTQIWVPLEQISPHLVYAVIAAEDARFCRHWGVDLTALGAVLRGEAPGGASTISQQTVKNLLLWPGRDYLRKGIELGTTPLIERVWGKRRMVELYLNEIEMGQGLFGAEAAARHWFGVPASKLSREQAARLAWILPAPRRRSPHRANMRRLRSILQGMDLVARARLDRCV